MISRACRFGHPDAQIQRQVLVHFGEQQKLVFLPDLKMGIAQHSAGVVYFFPIRAYALIYGVLR